MSKDNPDSKMDALCYHQLDKAVQKELVKMMKEEPMQMIRYLLIEAGRQCVEANAATMDLKQCSTFGKQRYQVKAKISIKKVPINTP